MTVFSDYEVRLCSVQLTCVHFVFSAKDAPSQTADEKMGGRSNPIPKDHNQEVTPIVGEKKTGGTVGEHSKVPRLVPLDDGGQGFAFCIAPRLKRFPLD